jgi:hypothetical protein
LAERGQHPEWPRPTNSWDDVAGFLLNVGSNATWAGITWMVLRVRAAGRPEMSREDAILVGQQTLLAEFVRLGLEPPNLDAMTRRVDQLKNGNWELLFFGGQHVPVRIEVSATGSAEGRSEVTILTPLCGIGGQQGEVDADGHTGRHRLEPPPA